MANNAEPADFAIRPATIADVPTILSFISGLAEYERLSHEMTATEEKLAETLFGTKPSAEVIIGFHQGEPAGFALFFTSYSTFLAKPGIYLEDLFVKPEHRGKGFGKSLLKHVAQIAVERDCGRLEWAVLDWNTPAIGFYLKIGAKPLDDWTTYRMTGNSLKNFAQKD